MDSAYSFDVAVVGGGLAGTTVASELARTAPRSFKLLLVESREPGPGSAYAAPSDNLFMNGSAISMSAVPGDKRHLVRWLGTGPEHALIPRRLFGRYLRERFYEAISQRPEFRVARAEARDLIPAERGFELVDDLGNRYRARNVVLALGNFPPDDSFLPEALRRHPGYVGDPWRFDARATGGDVLVIGSGLTALDAIAMLEDCGLGVRIHLVSRHGLIPATEGRGRHSLDPSTLGLRTETPYAMLRTMRAAAARHAAGGGDWRDVIEAVRDMSPSVWAAWSLQDRRRFQRHLQAFWAIHRYRAPEQTFAAFDRLDGAGRIVRHRGRIAAAQAQPSGALRVDVAGADRLESIDVRAAINCTGPNGNYERVKHPFVRNALARGVVRPDPLRLGLDATPDLRAIDARGLPNERLFALGPPLRGLFYETTAVPETCRQAAAIARDLVAEHVAARGLEAAS